MWTYQSLPIALNIFKNMLKGGFFAIIQVSNIGHCHETWNNSSNKETVYIHTNEMWTNMCLALKMQLCFLTTARENTH